MSAYKLFLGGLSPQTTTENVRYHFGKYGTIADAIVMMKDGKPRGFGFVTFETEDAMNDALAEEQVVDDRTVDVKPAVPGDGAPRGGDRNDSRRDYGRGDRDNGRGGKGGKGGGKGAPGSSDKVFIGGLAQSSEDDTVREYFDQFGTIIDFVVMKDRESGRSRGFGFVQYDNTDSVDSVMDGYKDHQIDGKWVEVKRAVPQDKGGGGGGGGGGKGGKGDRSSYGPSRGKGGSDHYSSGGYGSSPYGAPAPPAPSSSYGSSGGSYGGAYGGGAYGAPPPAYGSAYGAPPPAYGSSGAYGGYGYAAYPPPSGGGYGAPPPPPGGYGGSYSSYPPPSDPYGGGAYGR
eukprot:TRINITY_DN5062_c0_g1_i1.p1 TRINITY_DN5062_c0_g1~~TRINITY_DN5062_c0_g1_i1.p1  ORF type:complete len:344 (+),score=89.36 TRINITY_DN5062_c0_g1_i1:112-1143(+)